MRSGLGSLDVNLPNSEDHHRTPLHLAALSGSPDTVQALLDASADPTRRDDEGHTALDLARETEAAAYVEEVV